MKLTIGIPNFNGGELLKNTILSIDSNLILNKNEYEILVIDNCSTDNSIDIIKELQLKIKNIRLVQNDKNYGRIGNWNRVLKSSKGDRILFLMVGDKLLKFDYDKYFKNGNNNICKVFSFYEGNGNLINKHLAKKMDENFKCKTIIKISLKTLGNNYGLAILQSHFLDRNIINKYNLEFDENLPFLADIKFLNEYILNFKNITFLNKANIIWGMGLGKFTFKNQLDMFRDFLIYYPFAFNKYLNKNINLYKFKIYIVLRMFFIYLNNYRIGNSGFSFKEMISFIKKDIGNLFFIVFIIFEPLYILYLYINIKTNFKYVIKF